LFVVIFFQLLLMNRFFIEILLFYFKLVRLIENSINFEPDLDVILHYLNTLYYCQIKNRNLFNFYYYLTSTNHFSYNFSN